MQTTELILLTKSRRENDFEEWLRYHLALGFTHITIYDNESEIDLSAIIKKINDPRVAHFIISKTEMENAKQQGLYTWHHDRSEYDWQLYIDDDEFLSLPPLVPDVSHFVDNIPEYVDQFGIFWEMISSKEPLEKRTGTMIDTFYYVSPEPQHTVIKSFVRKRCKGQFLHPHKMYGPNLNCYSQIGRMEDLDGGRFRSANNDWAKIYHYRVRSREEYDMKVSNSTPDIPEKSGLDRGYQKYEDAHAGYIKYDDTMIKNKLRLGLK